MCGSLIDKLHGVESQLFDSKELTNITAGTSPAYNKWIRLSALYQMLFRSVAAHGATEDDILMLAFGIQMKRTEGAMRQGDLADKARKIFDTAVEEAEEASTYGSEEEDVAASVTRPRAKKVH